MFLKSLYLRNFRNYEQGQVNFGSKINLIQGGNAQGKTNLLEAIYFLSTGRSFRTSHLSDLIRYGQPFFYLEALFIREGIEQTVKLSFDGALRKMQVNSTAYSSFTNLLGLLPTVLYAPEDIGLIVGAPEMRRRFLDMHIAQIDPLYVHHLSRYFKAMKQRNHLLRHKSEASIEIWEQAMALSSHYLMQKRREAIHELKQPILESMQKLSKGKDLLEIHYQPSLSPSDILEQFKGSRAKEMRFGASLIGPHRDDLLITVDQKPAKVFSSEGQKRCSIAALRFAEWQRLISLIGAPPLMSIDDFGIHLDPECQNQLVQQLEGLGQVFLTSPHSQLETFPLSDKHMIAIEQGQVAVKPL